MKSLAACLERAYLQAEFENYANLVTVGDISEFKENELGEQERPFSFCDRKVVFYQFPSDTHDGLSQFQS